MQLSLKLLTGLLFGASLAANLDYCSMSNLKIRKNIKDLRPEEFERYVNAVKKLNSGSRPTAYDKYIQSHIQNYPSTHTLNSRIPNIFLAWHRMMLYSIEKELQKIDPEVTIPYWDWTKNSENINRDIAFSTRFFGGPSRDSSQCVSEGPFRNFKVGVTTDNLRGEFCIKRDNQFKGNFYSKGAVTLSFLDHPTIKGFSDIEGSAHARVHNTVGGTFQYHASPTDPLFYSHHAFVDQLWFVWQNRNLDKATDYTVPLSTNLPGFNVQVRDVIDPFDKLCVVYREANEFPWSKSDQSTRSEAATAQVVPESYPVKNTTDPKLLEKYDLEYVMKGIVDTANVRTTSENFVPLPELIPGDYIDKMGYDRAMIRQVERRIFLTINNNNINSQF